MFSTGTMPQLIRADPSLAYEYSTILAESTLQQSRVEIDTTAPRVHACVLYHEA